MYLNKILVTTDFSEAAAAAFPFARQRAASGKSSLSLLNVVESIQLCIDLEGRLPPQELIEKAELLACGRAREKLIETEKTYFADTHIDTVVLNSFQDVAHAICKYAEENNFGLIIMASQGKGFLKRIFPGSVASQVSRISKCPVLVVPSTALNFDMNHGRLFKNILVTTDFSEDSKNAFEYASYEAKANHAKLSLVNVYEQFLITDVSDLYFGSAAPDYLKCEQDYVAGLNYKLKAYARQNINMQSINTVVIEKVCSIAYTLSEYIKNDKYDLLIISTHGTGPAIKLIDGVVEEILKLSVCPVLVVPKAVK